jgi:hypothetical protein
MAIFKREPITHKLPTYYDDLEALGYVNLNNIEGLRIYDNPLVAEQNSTYSCKNVYKDELGNLTVRPSLQFNRKSIPCKWYYIFTDNDKTEYLFIKTDKTLECYKDNTQIALIDIQTGTNVIPQEYFATEASVATNSIYFLISDSSGFLDFLKFDSDSGFNHIEGEIQIVDADSPKISAYNILNKYMYNEEYLPEDVRTTEDYSVTEYLKETMLDKTTSIFGGGREFRWLSDSIFLFIDYSRCNIDDRVLTVGLTLYVYKNAKWTKAYNELTFNAAYINEEYNYTTKNYKSDKFGYCFTYTITDLSNSTFDFFAWWKGKFTLYTLTVDIIDDIEFSAALITEGYVYDNDGDENNNGINAYFCMPLYNDYILALTSNVTKTPVSTSESGGITTASLSTGSTTISGTTKNVYSTVISIYKLDRTSTEDGAQLALQQAITLGGTAGGDIPATSEGNRFAYPYVAAVNKSYAILIFEGATSTTTITQNTSTEPILSNIKAQYQVALDYSSLLSGGSVAKTSTTGGFGMASGTKIYLRWNNSYSSEKTLAIAMWMEYDVKTSGDELSVGTINWVKREIHSTSLGDFDLSDAAKYSVDNYSNPYISVANTAITMKYGADSKIFIVCSLNSNTFIQYSKNFEYTEKETGVNEFSALSAMIVNDGLTIAVHDGSTLLLEQRVVIPRKILNVRDSTTIPVLTDIRDKPITGFYLANTYWFIMEHYIFGTGAANEKLTIEFFDPYKYFAVSESITAAIRVSDTSFWVFHKDGAYLIYRTTTTDSDDNTVYRWLITNTAKSKGCDFENAVTTLPITSYIATVTSDDISSVQMKENIQSDERSLVPLTINLGTFIIECLNETKSIKIAQYKYLSLFILNRTESNGTTPVLVYDPNTSNWWYWELPVNEVYHVVQTETNVELLCNYDGDTVIYNFTTDWYNYNVGNLLYEIYADRLEASNEPTQISWVWESAIQLFNSVDYRKQLLSTTFTFGEYNKRQLRGGMDYNELSFRHEFEIYANKYSEKELEEEHDLTVERAKNRMVPTVIASFTYLQLIIKNSPYDPDTYEYDTLCKPQISSISFKYRTLPGGIT